MERAEDVMRWFRSRVRSGAALALAALALNLAAAFGHHHFDTLHVTTTATEQPLAAGHDDGHDDHAPMAAHPCFACIVTTVAAIAISPPSLPPHGAIRVAATTT